MIVTLDPGAHEAGVAVWHRDGILADAYLVRAARRDPWLHLAMLVKDELRDVDVEWVVIERPQVYVASRSKGDPNDLITLALMAGAVAGLLEAPFLTEYKPAQWKGQAPKDVMIERIIRALTVDEHTRVRLPDAKSLAHNVWDAIGIGLYHLRGKRRGRKNKI
jgi:hypothetical protein